MARYVEEVRRRSADDEEVPGAVQFGAEPETKTNPQKQGRTPMAATKKVATKKAAAKKPAAKTTAVKKAAKKAAKKATKKATKKAAK
jgi:DNA topoisomerase-1